MTLRAAGLTAVCLIGFAAPAVQADMIDTSHMAPWEFCAQCHSVDGISRMPKFPKLAGQRYAYLVKQLGDFQAERRTNDGGPMATNTESLTPAQIESVARYFSAQPAPPPAAAPQDAAAADRGRRLFAGGKPEAGIAACASCHVDGRANGVAGAVAPRLEAQHAGYLAKQLQDFRAGARANDAAGQMRTIAAALSDDEIEAVAGYAASLERPQGAAP
jgi:cytochrome c553